MGSDGEEVHIFLDESGCLSASSSEDEVEPDMCAREPASTQAMPKNLTHLISSVTAPPVEKEPEPKEARPEPTKKRIVPKQARPKTPELKQARPKTPELPDDPLQRTFQIMEQEIAAADQGIKALLGLKKLIQESAPQAFDQDEDLAWIDAELKRHDDNKKKVAGSLSGKKDFYERGISYLQQIESLLKSREAVLKAAEEQFNVLSLHADLTRKFAEKQAWLIRSMHEVRDNIAAQLNDSAAQQQI